MGAPDLLQHLRSTGFSVTVADGGGIRVMPAGALSAALRQAIRDHKPALLALLSPGNQPAVDPDRWCWPQSEAMNTAEIDRFRCRVVSFIRRGIGEAQGELVADLLVIRDRHHDGLHLCLECSRLSGFADQAWRCANHRAAGVSRDLAADLVSMPQRCQGFAERVAR